MTHRLSETAELPTLDAGVTLLESTNRVTGALQTLVLDHVLGADGPAVWVDANGHSTTQPLLQVAPSRQTLDRIRVARAFTPWQHQSLLRDLTDEVDDRTSLVVLPAFDAFYRTDDLRGRERKRMVARGAAVIETLVDEYEIPLLVTYRRTDALTTPVRSAVDDVVECEMTRFGPRFVGDGVESFVYPVGNGLLQTTFAFWQRVLETRHPAVATATTPEVSTVGSH